MSYNSNREQGKNNSFPEERRFDVTATMTIEENKSG